MSKKRVAVLFGGISPEHEVSVITATQVMKVIDPEKFELLPIYVTKQGTWLTGEALTEIENYRDLAALTQKAKEAYLLPTPSSHELKPVASKGLQLFGRESAQSVDVLFPCFHGGNGENGSFQGFAELVGLPYVGSGVVGSASGFDKVIMKDIFATHGIPQVKHQWFYRQEWEDDATVLLKKIENELQYPLFVKPANSGSSIGVAKANNHTELRHAIEVAACYDRKIVVEEGFSDARELNVSVLGNSGGELKASVCEEVIGSAAFLTYTDKYEGGAKSQGMASAKRIVPADIAPELASQLQELAKQAFAALDCAGVARVDFLVRDREIRVIEINTIPGSLSFYLWEASGIGFTELTSKLIELAISRQQALKRNVTSFDTDILQNFQPSLKNR